VRNNQLKLIYAGVLFLIVIGGLGWVNYQFAVTNPGGNDFLVHYVGTRSLIFEGLSPYSDEVAVRIQIAAYGHPAQGIEHELRVAYPLYSVFLFAPFSVISDYEIARAAWMTVLEVALVAMAFLSIKLVGWKPSLAIQGWILLFSLIWYHALRGVINGNAVILIGLLLTAVFSYIKSNNDELAGLFLAITTIKPHLVVLIIPFILVWAVYQKRYKVLAWFVGSMAILISLGLLIIPDWIYQNLWEILKYPGYNPAGTLAAALAEWLPNLEKEFKWGIAIILGFILLSESWKARKGNFSHFLWTGLLIMMISQWIGIQTDPGNFILLFPGLILVLSILVNRWEEKGTWISIGYLAVLFIVPWITFVITIQRTYQPVQNPIMFIPLPLLSLLGLYWTKWWVISSSRNQWDDSL
jgi:hypothetical protein